MKPLRTSSINRLRIKASETPKPRIAWQSYVLAALMVCGFLVFTQAVMAESKDVPEVAQTEELVAEKAEAPKAEVEAPEAKQEFFTVAADLETTPERAETFEEAVERVTVKAEPEEEPATENALASEVSPQPKDVAEEASTTENEPAAEAQAVVTQFYTDLGEGHLGTAYDKLAPEFQDTLPYTTFSRGYADTTALKCEVKYSEVINDDLVRLDVQLSVDEDGLPAQYYVTCLVEKQATEWLVSGVSQLRG